MQILSSWICSNENVWSEMQHLKEIEKCILFLSSLTQFRETEAEHNLQRYFCEHLHVQGGWPQ